MAPTAPAQVRQNPHWLRTGFASIGLAILLKVGFHIPPLRTLVLLGIIFLTHVILAEIGSSATTARSWAKNAGSVLLGMVVFLALRVIATKVLGISTTRTWEALRSSGGLYGFLWGDDPSSVLLWEICFAMVAAQITTMWVKGTHKLPVRIVIFTSLVVLSLQLTPGWKAYPRAAWGALPSWPTTWHWRSAAPAASPVTRPRTTRLAPAAAPAAPLAEAEPLFIRAETPAQMTVDFRFSLESDGPVRVTYVDGQSFVYEPGQGCQQAPRPRFSGPKRFTDPNDEAEGHVAFRLYRLRPGEGACN